MSQPSPEVVAAVDAPVDDRTHDRQVRAYGVELRALSQRIRDLRTQLTSAQAQLSRMLDDSASGLADADHGAVTAILRTISDAVRP